MAEPVRVRRLTDQEGQRLRQIVRRGSTSSVRYRRAMMPLASAGGNRVPVIAQLVQADEDTDTVHLTDPDAATLGAGLCGNRRRCGAVCHTSRHYGRLRLAVMPERGQLMDSQEQLPGRRRFLGYVIAASTLTVAAQLGELVEPEQAQAAIPSPPEPAELYDLNDLLTDAALPTSNLISIQLNSDGTAAFALPRAEVGQGVTTSSAMLIAEELDLPLDRVRVSLSDARPELVFN